MPEVNQGFLPMPPYYKRDFPQYNVPNMRVPTKSNFYCILALISIFKFKSI